eukprot:3903380-Rhodomonas_salina.1
MSLPSRPLTSRSGRPHAAKPNTRNRTTCPEIAFDFHARAARVLVDREYLPTPVLRAALY